MLFCSGVFGAWRQNQTSGTSDQLLTLLNDNQNVMDFFSDLLSLHHLKNFSKLGALSSSDHNALETKVPVSFPCTDICQEQWPRFCGVPVAYLGFAASHQRPHEGHVAAGGDVPVGGERLR